MNKPNKPLSETLEQAQRRIEQEIIDGEHDYYNWIMRDEI
jgi:hypothetical protein